MAFKTVIKYTLAVCLISCVGTLKAQQLTQEQELVLQERLELIANQNQSSNIDFSVYLDRLYDYLQTPLDLNSATLDDLQNLGLLNAITQR